MTPISRLLVRGKPQNVVITDRDRKIFRDLYDRRFLTTDHIELLTNSKSRTKLNYRLKTLFDSLYLDRPRVQQEVFSHAKKRPLVHALGNKGAQYIEETLGFRVPRTVDWTDKNRKVTSKDFLMHTLGISDFFVTLNLRVAELNNIQMLDQNGVIAQAPGRTATLTYPLRLPTAFDWLNDKYVERSTVPDGIFTLIDSRGDNDPLKAFHFLEYDANTMPVVRKSVNQSSIVKKMLGYADVYERRLHTDLFGYKNFRVLFVTHGKNRIQSMIAAYDQHIRDLCPPGAFMFTDYGRLMSSSPFADIWVNGNGERAVLVPDLL